MQFLQTPEDRFSTLTDFPFDPHYVEVGDGMRMHFVDEGPSEAPIVLLLHGEPSWSYLYRKMIPVITAAGFRAIAPDLIGFGKSDKPTNISDYSYAKHMEWMSAFIQSLDLKAMHLFCQDWGGLLGLRLLVNLPERFDSAIAANTALPAGKVAFPPAFQQWKDFAHSVPELPVGKIIDMGTTTELSPDVIAGYDAPYPDESYKAGARAFPALVPMAADDPESLLNVKAWQKLQQWNKPFLTLFSDSDPIMKGGEKYFQSLIPGANGQAHTIIENAGHFLQEDQGEAIAEKVVTFVQSIVK